MSSDSAKMARKSIVREAIALITVAVAAVVKVTTKLFLASCSLSKPFAAGLTALLLVCNWTCTVVGSELLGVITTRASGLASPSGVWVDTALTVYVAEPSSRIVRKINSAGVVTNFAGTGAQGFNGNNGQATG